MSDDMNQAANLLFSLSQKVAQLVLHLADLRAAGHGRDGVLHGGDGAGGLPPQRQLLHRSRTQPREPPPLPPGHPGSGENNRILHQTLNSTDLGITLI